MSPHLKDAKPLSSRIRNAVAEIESLIGGVQSETSGPEALVCEHLQSARFYLLGGMWDEYRFSLQLLTSAKAQLKNKALRKRVTAFVETQQDLLPQSKTDGANR